MYNNLAHEKEIVDHEYTIYQEIILEQEDYNEFSIAMFP